MISKRKTAHWQERAVVRKFRCEIIQSDCTLKFEYMSIEGGVL